MRRSFVRIILSIVVLFWILTIAVVVVYATQTLWTEDRARHEGVFLIFELLDAAPLAERPARLEELSLNTWADLSIVSLEEVAEMTGAPLPPGEARPYAEAPRLQWYFFAFSDGEGALAAGPVNPTIPARVRPIGVFLVLAFIPIAAGLIAYRIERAISPVEQASRTLAQGDLSARVHPAAGASDELASTFNEMADRIETLVRSRDELVQAISHELGSPLSRLRLHLQLPERSDETGETRTDAMTRELDALDALVTELLGYIQTDDTKAQTQVFAAESHIQDLVELTCLELEPTSEVKVELTVPEGLHVDADPRLFQRALENLLRNAVRYAAARVELVVEVDQEGVVATVHDDGPGIPEIDRTKVLRPFVRVDAARGRSTGGAGLGLAIVDRIVRRHGGSVRIETSPLGGAAVITRWPSGGGPLLRA